MAGETVQDPVDWAAIERTPEFRELTTGRRRFAFRSGVFGIGLGVLYIVLAGVSPDLMGTHLIGSMSLGFAGGVALIVVTLVITLLYMRRSDAVWGPLEERIREQARSTSAATPGTADAKPDGGADRVGTEVAP